MKSTKLATNAVYVCFFFLSGLYEVSGTNCSDYLQRINNNLPVLRFCTDDKVESTFEAVLDGHYANTLKGENKCTCTARAFSGTASHSKYVDLHLPSSFINDYTCGSKVVFAQLNYNATTTKNCSGNGSLPITDGIKNITVSITLIKEVLPYDTRYCFSFYFAAGSSMGIVCEKGGTTTDATDASTETFNTFSTFQQESTSNNNPSLHNSEKIHQGEKGSSYILYLAIGCGIGGLLITFISICLIYKLRKTQRPVNDNDVMVNQEEYGLQYNTLYVSTDNNYVQKTINGGTESYKINVNHVAYQLEGNHSDIDLDNLQKNKTETISREAVKMAGHHNINIEGDYSAIGNIASVEEAQNMEYKSSSVRHVIAPGDGGCEYAVVEKHDEENRSDVYAVVNKTKRKKP